MSDVVLRCAQPEDEAFLLGVYASARQEELMPLPWSDAEKAAFLAQQGAAQHRHYRAYYPDADYRIILVDGEQAGRLYVARWPGELRLMDLTLLPAYRNRGIGTALMRQLMAEARREGVPITLHVEAFNPALRLYERLGFCVREVMRPYLFMALTPTPEVTHDVG